MRKIREMLRLRFVGLKPSADCRQRRSVRSIHGPGVFAARRGAGLTWPLPEELDDEPSSRRCCTRRSHASNVALPDFAHLQRELSRPGVTRHTAVAGVQGPTPRWTAVQRVLRSVSAHLLNAPPSR